LRNSPPCAAWYRSAECDLHSVKVNQKAANRLASGHPWIFASDVLDRGSAEPGEAVHVYDNRKRPLGTAHYSSESQITLRFLSRELIEPDKDFFSARIARAADLRKRVVADSTACRLVHGEGDLLPGLIVDVYADCVVVQTLTQSMDRAKGWIVNALLDQLSPRTIIERNDVAVRSRESLPLTKGVLHGGNPGPVAISMNGMHWRADLLGGQKTGVYLDQRENYVAAARHGRGQALDCFTSTGGFALHLARTCTSVEGVDSSEAALKTARANQQANGIGNVTFKEADVFELLTTYAAARKQFDTIVLDPPAFTKSRAAIAGAMRGYKEINQRALRLLGPGGVLVTCSCSHHFSEAMLLETVAQAALDTGRTLRVLERRTQAQDHPILLTVPETLYLKCLMLEVI
jgi:23S rRNA (cytosine1962-C5)-methyltransferase